MHSGTGPAVGAYSAPPDSIAGLRDLLLREGKEWYVREGGKWKEKEKKEGKVGEFCSSKILKAFTVPTGTKTTT